MFLLETLFTVARVRFAKPSFYWSYETEPLKFFFLDNLASVSNSLHRFGEDFTSWPDAALTWLNSLR